MSIMSPSLARLDQRNSSFGPDTSFLGRLESAYNLKSRIDLLDYPLAPEADQRFLNVVYRAFSPRTHLQHDMFHGVPIHVDPGASAQGEREVFYKDYVECFIWMVI